MQFEQFKDSRATNILHNQMYLEKVPEGLLKALE
jgi:hypothetical protein